MDFGPLGLLVGGLALRAACTWAQWDLRHPAFSKFAFFHAGFRARAVASEAGQPGAHELSAMGYRFHHERYREMARNALREAGHGRSGKSIV
ncbi:MAG: hypothetical protein ACRDZX_02830 [Acidimicrobiales bacterium]